MSQIEGGKKGGIFRLNHFSTHPQGVVIDNHQGKLMSFVNLVFSSDKHFDHLLGNVQRVCFRPIWKMSEVSSWVIRALRNEGQLTR